MSHKLEYCPLCSSSSGNSALLTADGAHYLVDAGAACRTLEKLLKEANCSAAALSGILITHEHTDHCKGAGALSRKYGLPIYASRGTWAAMRPALGELPEANCIAFESGSDFFLDELRVTPFPIPHDAADPVGFAFDLRGVKISSATDMGFMAESVFQAIRGSALVLLESNHDVELLKNGRYPARLKARILGRRGHLSNEACARTVASLAMEGARAFLLGHLSAENNRPELALAASADALSKLGLQAGADADLLLAGRSAPEKNFVFSY